MGCGAAAAAATLREQTALRLVTKPAAGAGAGAAVTAAATGPTGDDGTVSAPLIPARPLLLLLLEELLVHRAPPVS
ncbi:MAG: hypothetical protein WDW38_003840 [Sanguina aurantia]